VWTKLARHAGLIEVLRLELGKQGYQLAPVSMLGNNLPGL
jgi:hypothetical protein